MHDQWYFASEQILEDRSTLVQQDQNLENNGESQIFEIQHIGYRDFIIRHHLTGLVLTIHNGSPSPCAPVVLCRYMGTRTPYQTVNFERSNDQSNDMLIFVKHTRMVIDVDGGSQNSNARLLQTPLKKHNVDHISQHFRLHRVNERIQQQITPTIPEEFFR
ncbi:hypothetical protein I4U23_014726 [Adineta vaga]|nr:hypothetical protein I4U23_014726 [Adineta vaga]